MAESDRDQIVEGISAVEFETLGVVYDGFELLSLEDSSNGFIRVVVRPRRSVGHARLTKEVPPLFFVFDLGRTIADQLPSLCEFASLQIRAMSEDGQRTRGLIRDRLGIGDDLAFWAGVGVTAVGFAISYLVGRILGRQWPEILALSYPPVGIVLTLGVVLSSWLFLDRRRVREALVDVYWQEKIFSLLEKFAFYVAEQKEVSGRRVPGSDMLVLNLLRRISSRFGEQVGELDSKNRDSALSVGRTEKEDWALGLVRFGRRIEAHFERKKLMRGRIQICLEATDSADQLNESRNENELLVELLLRLDDLRADPWIVESSPSLFLVVGETRERSLLLVWQPVVKYLECRRDIEWSRGRELCGGVVVEVAVAKNAFSDVEHVAVQIFEEARLLADSFGSDKARAGVVGNIFLELEALEEENGRPEVARRVSEQKQAVLTRGKIGHRPASVALTRGNAIDVNNSKSD